jgi:hypothetical protein
MATTKPKWIPPVKFFDTAELRVISDEAYRDYTLALRPDFEFPYSAEEVFHALWLCKGWQSGELNLARPLKEKRAYAHRIAMREIDLMYRGWIGGGMVPPEPPKNRDTEDLREDRARVIQALRNTIPLGQVVDNTIRRDPETGMLRDRVLERCPIIRALEAGESLSSIRRRLADEIGIAGLGRRRFLASLRDECYEYARLTGDEGVWKRVLPAVAHLRGRRGAYKPRTRKTAD